MAPGHDLAHLAADLVRDQVAWTRQCTAETRYEGRAALRRAETEAHEAAAADVEAITRLAKLLFEMRRAASDGAASPPPATSPSGGAAAVDGAATPPVPASDGAATPAPGEHVAVELFRRAEQILSTAGWAVHDYTGRELDDDLRQRVEIAGYRHHDRATDLVSETLVPEITRDGQVVCCAVVVGASRDAVTQAEAPPTPPEDAEASDPDPATEAHHQEEQQ